MYVQVCFLSRALMWYFPHNRIVCATWTLHSQWCKLWEKHFPPRCEQCSTLCSSDNHHRHTAKPLSISLSSIQKVSYVNIWVLSFPGKLIWNHPNYLFNNWSTGCQQALFNWESFPWFFSALLFLFYIYKKKFTKGWLRFAGLRLW